MKRYASYSKILEDTRVHKRGAYKARVSDRMGVPRCLWFLNANHHEARTKQAQKYTFQPFFRGEQALKGTKEKMRIRFWSSNVAWKPDFGIFRREGVFSGKIFLKMRETIQDFIILSVIYSDFTPLEIRKNVRVKSGLLFHKSMAWLF